MTTQTVGVIALGGLFAVVLAARPIPTRQLRFRWRYQRGRVLCIGPIVLVLYAGLTALANYLIEHHLTPKPSGWFLRALVAGGLVSVLLRVDIGAIDQLGMTEGRSLGKEASRRLAELMTDPTQEAVLKWVISRTSTYRSTAALVHAVHACTPESSRAEQTLMRSRVDDISQKVDRQRREDARLAIRVWAADTIIEHSLLLPRGWEKL